MNKLTIFVSVVFLLGFSACDSIIEKHEQNANSCLQLYFKVIDQKANHMKAGGDLKEWAKLAKEIAHVHTNVSKHCAETASHKDGKPLLEKLVKNFDKTHHENCGKTALVFLEFNKVVQEVGKKELSHIEKKLGESSKLLGELNEMNGKCHFRDYRGELKSLIYADLFAAGDDEDDDDYFF